MNLPTYKMHFRFRATIAIYIYVVFVGSLFPKLNEAEINIAVIYGPKGWFQTLPLKTKTSFDAA